MPFSGIDTAGVARYLASLPGGSVEMRPEAYFERLSVLELPPDGEPPGLRWRGESGLSIRLVSDTRSWSAGRDRIDSSAFEAACRQVVRSRPVARPAAPEIEPVARPEPEACAELDRFARQIHQGLRDRRVGFPLRLWIRAHRRDVLTITDQLAPAPQSERYYSVVAETTWGRTGALCTELELASAEAMADRLVARFAARDAEPVGAWRGHVLLGPGAVGVFLHEAVAHALEADTLALGGSPESAIGVELAAESVDIIDDPTDAPLGVSRSADDEGFETRRRWLLRRGRVEQPLADQRWASRFGRFEAGAGRRAHRYLEPMPRSTFLQLLPGATSFEAMVEACGDGLYLPEADRGRLEPATGTFVLRCPHGRWIRGGELGPRTGPCVIRAGVADWLGSIVDVGGDPEMAGSGWCAKGGGSMPVWARVPPVRLEDVQCRV